MVTNRVFKVLATNGTAMTNLADAGAGKYLIVKEDLSTVTATTALERDEKIMIVVNSQNGTKQYSDKIRVGDINSYVSKPFAAKVEQVVTLTPGTPTADFEYTVSIIDKSDKEILQNRQAKRTYTVVAAVGETATTLVTKFKDQINKDVASPVVASGTATLIITAKNSLVDVDKLGQYPNQIVFDVFASVINPTARFAQPVAFGTLAVTAAPAFGSGQFHQLVRLEQDSQGYKGLTNFTMFPADVFSAGVVAGTNYDVAVLEYDNRHDTNVVVEGEKAAPLTIFLAVTAGASAGVFAILARLAQSGNVAAGV